jgi:hypothetical protein
MVTQTCDDRSAQPCPQLPASSFSADTKGVPDGKRTFSVVVTDAAGNGRTVVSPPVLVDNYGPPAPTAFTATPRGAGSNVIALTWGDPPNPPAPLAGAMVQLCQSGTCAAPVSAVTEGGGGQAVAPGPGSYELRLWLVDAHGRGGPHNAATTTATVPSSRKSSSRTRITAVVRNGRLHVSGTIASGRRATVTWRSTLRGRTVGHGARVVTIRKHRLAATFRLGSRARRGVARVTIRVGRRVAARARARRT